MINKTTKVVNFNSIKQFLAYLDTLSYLPTNFNRPINKKHAKKLAEVIEEFGLLRAIIAIETSCFDTKDSVTYIGDGQHLRYALLNYVDPKKIVGLISVVVVTLENKDEVIPLISSLNSTASNWTMLNYLNGWCADGKEEYLYLQSIMKQTKFGLGALVEAFLGERPKGNDKFKKGNLKLKRTIGTRLLADYNNAVAVGLFKSYKSFQAYIRIRTDFKDLTNTELLHMIAENDMFADGTLNRELYLYYFRDGIISTFPNRYKNNKNLVHKKSTINKIEKLEVELI